MNPVDVESIAKMIDSIKEKNSQIKAQIEHSKNIKIDQTKK
jgi:hypothetical protein